jgi:hypothetical protein
MPKFATIVSHQDIIAAFDCLTDLDRRLMRSELDHTISTWLRGDFDFDMVNMLRSEFDRLWRNAEASADVDVIG